MSRSSTTTFAPSEGTAKQRSRGFSLPLKSRIAVVGAGAFGGWTALFLTRAGYRVTLVDAWGPGHSRSSSGDETRVIRSTYGSNEFYFDLNIRALQLWKENQTHFGRQLFHNVGVLWLCYREQEPLVDDSIPFSKKHKQPYEYLNQKDLRKRFPVIHSDDLHHAYLDPFGGYLKARESCQAVVESFVREGGSFLQGMAHPPHSSHKKIAEVVLADNTRLEADAVVYACGPWLPQLFPDLLGNRIACTRQEAYYFGVDSAFARSFDSLPCWVDVDGSDYYYGIPGNAYRGFKIGVDRRGAEFDPTHGEHLPSSEVLEHARKFIGHRFPALKNAPLVENRVCPYECTRDGNFLIDQHPLHDNVWFLGGGSGHGFKHGPAVGELVADVIRGKREVPPMLRIGSR